MLLEEPSCRRTSIDAWVDAFSGNDATVTPIDEWEAGQDGDVEAPEIAVATTVEEGEEKEEPDFIYNLPYNVAERRWR